MVVLNCALPVLPGYAVTSVVSARSGRLLVAGAPRFNHTGKVIIFTLKNTGNLTILHSLKGQQVYILLIFCYAQGFSGSIVLTYAIHYILHEKDLYSFYIVNAVAYTFVMLVLAAS